MNRNSELHFSQMPPSLDISRSKFDLSHGHTFDMNEGVLRPMLLEEVYPGDTFQIKNKFLTRMLTPMYPVMGTAFFETFYFFVPNRLVWSHWKEFQGENNTSAWTPSTVYQIPQVDIPSTTGCSVGKLGDAFGIPVGVGKSSYFASVNALPFRAYRLIWNEFFRSEALQAPVLVNTGDSESDISLNDDLLKVCKLHDIFTNCLPEPQRGDEVLLPLGQDAVVVPQKNGSIPDAVYAKYGSAALTWADPNNNSISGSYSESLRLIVGTDGNTHAENFGDSEGSSSSSAHPANLVADLSTATAASVNDLRLAFATQRILEKLALGGRYVETIKSLFGVTCPDFRLQRPEYIGGLRKPININQVLQNSAGASVSDRVGVTGAYSLTVGEDESYTYSATEHGFIIGLCCIRTERKYDQTLDQIWQRKDYLDFYQPALANLGYQPIMKNRICTTGTTSDDDVFGYQEAWCELRTHNSKVTGAMRPSAPTSLSAWTFCDNYNGTAPTLGSTWIQEDQANVDHVIQISGSPTTGQFLVDMWFDEYAIRPMPVFSIPGLIDHH